ncbi:MAG: trans-sulfuration enzyme family protein [Candidatus Xenobia bacterium]
MQLETLLIHAGERAVRPEGAVVLPIYQSATFEYTGAGAYDDVRYARLSNTPNHTVVHDKLAALEGAEAALVTASGMAAITAVLLTVLPPRGHLLLQDVVYGGTHSFCTETFDALGLRYDFIDTSRPETWAEKLQADTRAIYVESISNPLMDVGRLDAVPAFARQHNLISIVDNTFATPVNFQPARQGFDLSVHSGTKYLNGHSDIVCGAVIGRRDLVDRVRHTLGHLGGSLDPHACWLLHRGIKTLALRVRQQQASALSLARYLAQAPGVRRVNYPGLPDHPRHELAARLFQEGFGGMLSFEIDGDADRFIHALKLAVCAPSLGGVETLVTRPATTSHSGMSPADRARAGISDMLIRVSVGIEAAEDLMADFKQALRAPVEV